MFGRLKEKLKGALKVFSKEVEEEAVVEEEIVEEPFVEKPKKVVEKKEKEVVEEKPKKEEKKVILKEIPVSKKEEVIVEEKVEEVVEEEPVEQSTDISEEEPVEEAKEEAAIDEPLEEIKPKKSFFGKVFGKKEKAVEQPSEISEDEVVEESKEEELEEPHQESADEKRKKEGFFSRLTRVTLTEEKFESLFWDLELILLENNVAVEVIERIKKDLKTALSGEKASKKSIDELILETLHNTLKEILSVTPINLLKLADEKKKEGKPLIITMIGVNGSGKTTTLAKLIKYFQNHNKSVVVAAADTFRAAAIHQLEEHTTKLGVKLIKHDYHADPAAVAFDAVKHATAKGLDIVLIDSAGRLHSNDNLMNELKKLIRVNSPDINIFVGEAITGNDCVEQATLFDAAVGIDAIILAKADVDEKGGAAISASFVTGKPVIFLGVGQGYDDLQVFNPKIVLESLGL